MKHFLLAPDCPLTDAVSKQCCPVLSCLLPATHSHYSALYLALCSVRVNQHKSSRLKVFWFRQRKRPVDSCEQHGKVRMLFRFLLVWMSVLHSGWRWSFGAMILELVLTVRCYHKVEDKFLSYCASCTSLPRLLFWLWAHLTCSKHINLTQPKLCIAFYRLMLD